MFFFQLPWLPEAFLRFGKTTENVFRGMAVRKDTFTDEDIAKFREAILIPGAASGMINYYRAIFRSFGEMQRIEREAKKISSPTLLIWAEDDVALGKELTHGMEPLFTSSFRIHYVPKCSHWVNEEQPELINRLLLEHLG